jgi:hypothetical protein
MSDKKGQITLPAQTIEIYCDTCGYPLKAFIEYDGNGEPDEGNRWLISVTRCDTCDHRRDVESYRRGWEDYKKFGASVVSQAQERRIRVLKEEEMKRRKHE